MRTVRNLLALFFGALTLGGALAWITVRPWWHRWGVDPRDTDRPLPGDDVIPDGTSDTRSISIAAPPAAVWPWLMQMGYGRGGWYSYDAVDMRGHSADTLDPEVVDLGIGEVVPTHPDGGFEVRVLEPGRALVLYMDTQLAVAQAEAARSRLDAGEVTEATPANLKAAGAMLGRTSPPDFAASWAFVLEDEGGGRTRLIERLRTRMGGGGRPASLAAPLLGFGVFVMVRRQMLGIRARVERVAGA